MAKSGSQKRRRLRRLGSYQDDLCFFCDRPLIYKPEELPGEESLNSPDHASFGHYLSRKAGGSAKQANCVVAHRQCNSELGHEPTPDFDEKFRILNIRRGYDVDGPADPRLLRRMQPDAFGKPFPALEYLCDSANAQEGEEGVRIRRRIVRRLEGLIATMNGLRAVENIALRHKAVRAIHAQRIPADDMPSPLNTLLENVMITMIRREENQKIIFDHDLDVGV